jgi:hypothetical protein
METFTAPRTFVKNEQYNQQRRLALENLVYAAIDTPIVDIIRGFAQLEYCFTLQCCYGHFLYPGQSDRHNLQPLPERGDIITVEYRIAYLALCIQDSVAGRAMYDRLDQMAGADPDYLQFGSADWFWERQVNSYALQVEPVRHQNEDSHFVDYPEALHIERIRNRFFDALRAYLQECLEDNFRR